MKINTHFKNYIPIFTELYKYICYVHIYNYNCIINNKEFGNSQLRHNVRICTILLNKI